MTALPASFTNKTRPSDCIVWTGAIQTSGYGSVGVGDGRTALAHRVAWEHVNGPIPDGMTIDHLCHFKRCVNVDHMELVSRSENIRRRYEGADSCIHGHVLTPDNVIEKRRADGGTMRNCRKCQNESARRHRQRAKAARADLADSA